MDAQTFTLSEQGGPCHFNPSDFTCAICRPGKCKFKIQYHIYLNVKIEKKKYLSSFFSFGFSGNYQCGPYITPMRDDFTNGQYCLPPNAEDLCWGRSEYFFNE